MGLRHLDRLFHPRSIAVIGASPKADAIGGAVMTNLVEGGFAGEVLPINPKYDEIQGRRCWAHLADVPSAPDLAVVAIPIDKVPDVIEEGARTGLKGAVILSAGGRETGEKGRRLEAIIKEKADAGGIRIIGPNCLGIACTESRLNASFMAHRPPPGKLAFISQSGAICSAMLDLALKENMGFQYFISIGSMLDVDFGDLIDFVGSDPNVSSVLLYIESLSHFRKFMSAARAVSRMKPIVVLKSGRSDAGIAAAASHTGAMAGDDQIYEAAFRRAGAVRVRTLGDFFDCAELLAKQDPPAGRKLTILTNSGGPGVMAADAAAQYGLTLAPLDKATRQELDAVLPAHWSGGNPIDILGDAGADRYAAALAAIDARETDSLLIILNPQAMIDPTEVAADLADALIQRDLPVYTSWMGGQEVEKGTRILNEAGIPTYPDPEQAIRAIRYLYDYGRNLKLLQEIPPKIEHALHFDRDSAAPTIEKGLARGSGLLTEAEAKSVLAAYSIPVNETRLAESREEALRLARELGFPLAMKIASPDIVHKSQAGGVRLGLASEAAVAKAYDAILQGLAAASPEARCHGVTLQPMQTDIEVELLMGAKHDANFGPVLLFGWGGVHAEILADRNLALAPLNRLLARRLMEDTRVFEILSKTDGAGAADLEALEEMLVCLSHLMIDFPEIKELDLNPVTIAGGRPCAVDARIVTAAAEATAPHHLVISAYPSAYEASDVAIDGLRVCIRPIKPEDAPLLEAMFDDLSPTSIYHRFFSPLKSLPHHMLVRFTQIDYDREIALVALDQEAPELRMLGVARVIGTPGGRKGEFAVLVADPWQGKGIGGELLLRALRIAQARGMENVWGTAMAENMQMAKLARRLGFDVRRNASGEYTMTIDLTRTDLDQDAQEDESQ
jgi:acetyltransferase